MAIGFLEKHGYAVFEQDASAGRAKLVRLTPRGEKAHGAYRQLLGVIEQRWQTRFGEGEIRNLRESLGRLVGEPTAERSPLFRVWSRTPKGGARRSESPTRSRTIRWCCTAAAIPMAVDARVTRRPCPARWCSAYAGHERAKQHDGVCVSEALLSDEGLPG